MNLAEPVQISQQLAQVLEALNIPYLIGGSLASSLYGIPRATQDVDIVAAIKSQHIPLLVSKLKADFYIDADMIQEAIQTQNSFNILHLATMFKVDIFILQQDQASQQEMTRRQAYQISDNPLDILFLASAEDVICHKLYWYQLGDAVSERQWRDILGIIQVQRGNLDLAYLNQMAQARGVSSLLKKIIEESDL